MKKTLILTATSICSIFSLYGEEFDVHGEKLKLSAEEVPAAIEDNDAVRDQYGYFTYGFGLPGIFGLNLGVRQQLNHNGFEVGVGVVPLVVVYEVHAFASYLYYPKPSLDSQFYFGLGLRGGYADVSYGRPSGTGYAAPGMIFGKSFRTSADNIRFFQVAYSPAMLVLNEGKIRPVQSINVSYGYCF